MRTRLFLVPAAMALALGSLAFNMSDIPSGTDVPDGGSSLETGPFDGGGLETSTCTDNFADICAPSGSFGCAGGGGPGGSGGQGGAASVALLAVGSTTSVNVSNGAFVVGHAGNGGPGGDGENGGQSVDGGPMGATLCYGQCSLSCPSSGLSPGSPGSGSSGGAGGKGGGGSGGPAYDYVELSGAHVNVLTPSTLDASVTGTPGTGGANNGPIGSAGVHP